MQSREMPKYALMAFLFALILSVLPQQNIEHFQQCNCFVLGICVAQRIKLGKNIAQIVQFRRIDVCSFIVCFLFVGYLVSHELATQRQMTAKLNQMFPYLQLLIAVMILQQDLLALNHANQRLLLQKISDLRNNDQQPFQEQHVHFDMHVNNPKNKPTYNGTWSKHFESNQFLQIPQFVREQDRLTFEENHNDFSQVDLSGISIIKDQTDSNKNSITHKIFYKCSTGKDQSTWLKNSDKLGQYIVGNCGQECKSQNCQKNGDFVQDLSNHLLSLVNKQVLIFKLHREKTQINIDKNYSDLDVGAILSNGISSSSRNIKYKNKSCRSINIDINRIKKINDFTEVSNSKPKIGFVQFSPQFFQLLPFYQQVVSLKKAQDSDLINNLSITNSSGDIFMLQSNDQNSLLKNLESNNSFKLQGNESIVVKLAQNENKESQKQLRSFRQQVNHKKATINNQQSKIVFDKPTKDINKLFNNDFNQADQQFKLGNFSPKFRSNDIKARQSKKEQNMPKRFFQIQNNQEFISSNQGFIQLSNLQKEMIDLKIFEPYFVNHQTKLQYKQRAVNLSIMQILHSYQAKQASVKRSSRLYFKVNLDDTLIISILMNQKSSKSQKIGPKKELEHSHLNNDSSSPQISMDQNQKLQSQLINEYVMENRSVIITKKKKLIHKKINVQEFLEQSIESHLKLNESIETSSSSSSSIADSKFDYNESVRCQNNQDDKMKFFEFEFVLINKLQKYQDEYADCYMLNIRDVTNLIKCQKQLSDNIYQQAIEGNYSHCQMTPLNTLTQTSPIINNKVCQLQNTNQQLFIDILEHIQQDQKFSELANTYTYRIVKLVKDNSILAQKILNLSDNNHQSANQLLQLNLGQLKRIQIHQNKFKLNETLITDLPSQIEKQFKNFKQDIMLKKLNVYIITKNLPDHVMQADWDNFDLIFFNLIHNAIKFNYPNGDICLIITAKKHRKMEQSAKFSNYHKNQQMPDQVKDSVKGVSIDAAQLSKIILDIQICDSGEGISSDRQQLLFVPFMELRESQSITIQSKNDNIGLGLSASKQIAKGLKGDLVLQQSQEGLTIFRLRLPVTVISKNVSNINSLAGSLLINKSSLQEIDQIPNNAQDFSHNRLSCSGNQQNSSNSIINSILDKQSCKKLLLRAIQLYGKNQNSFSQLLGKYLQKKYRFINTIKMENRLSENQHDISEKSIDCYRIEIDERGNCSDSNNQLNIQINKSQELGMPQCMSNGISVMSQLSQLGSRINANQQPVLNQVDIQHYIDRCQAIMHKVRQNEIPNHLLNDIQALFEHDGDSSISRSIFSYRDINKIEAAIQQDFDQIIDKQADQSNQIEQHEVANAGHREQNHNFNADNEQMQPDGNLIGLHVNSNVKNSVPQNFNKIMQKKFPALNNQNVSGQILKRNCDKLNPFDSKQQKQIKYMILYSNQKHPIHKQKSNVVQEIPKYQQSLNSQQQSPLIGSSKVQQNIANQIISLQKNQQQQPKGRINQLSSLQQQDKVNQRPQNPENQIQSEQILQNIVENLIVHDIDVDQQASYSSEDELQMPKDRRNNQFKVSIQALKNNYIKLDAGPADHHDNQVNNQQQSKQLQQQQQIQQYPIIKNIIKIKAENGPSQQKNSHPVPIIKNMKSSKQILFKNSLNQVNSQNKYDSLCKKQVINFNSEIPELNRQPLVEKFEEEKEPYQNLRDRYDENQLMFPLHSRKSNNQIDPVQDQFIVPLCQNIDQFANQSCNQVNNNNLSQIDEREELVRCSSQHRSNLDVCGSFLDNDILQNEQPDNQIICFNDLDEIDKQRNSQDKLLFNDKIECKSDRRSLNKQKRISNRQIVRNKVKSSQMLQYNQNQVNWDQPDPPRDKLRSVIPKKANKISGNDLSDIMKMSQLKNLIAEVRSNQIGDDFIQNNQQPLENLWRFKELPCGCKPMILIVDDNAFNLSIQQEMIHDHLQKHVKVPDVSVLTHTATDGDIAVELVQQALKKQCQCENMVYRLIVMDLQMQKMDGNVAAKEINKLISETNLLLILKNSDLVVNSISEQVLSAPQISDQHNQKDRYENQIQDRPPEEIVGPNCPNIQEPGSKNIICNIVACTANTTQHFVKLVEESGMVQMINKPLNPEKIDQMLSRWYFKM